MSAHARGNFGASRDGKSFMGSSSTKVVPFGWAAVTGNAGDKFYLDAANLPIKYGAVNLGIFFQSEVPATVSFSLCHPEYACDPDPAIQGSVLWGEVKSLAVAELWGKMLVFTAIKIEFAGKGTVYVGAM